MFGEQHSTSEKVGQRLGFLFSYLVFTTVMYFIILVIRGHNMHFIQVMLITLAVSFMGLAIGRLLK